MEYVGGGSHPRDQLGLPWIVTAFSETPVSHVWPLKATRVYLYIFKEDGLTNSSLTGINPLTEDAPNFTSLYIPF